MTNLRAVLLPATVALLTAAFAVPSQAENSFDGSWNVNIVADPGCKDKYAVAIRVDDGNVKYQSLLLRALGTGKVNERGHLTAQIAKVKISGRLAEITGSGKWRSPDCTGTWTARRAA